jgi:hypothetical protein
MKFINYCRSCSSNTCTTRPAILAPFMTDRIFWYEHINCFTMDSFSHLLSKHFRIIAKKEEKFLHVLCEDI